MTLIALAWLFTLGVLVHNIEEAFLLPAWSKRAGRWHPMVGNTEFVFAVTVLSSALIGLAATASLIGAKSIWAHAFAGYVFTMVLNVFVPHVLGTIALRRYFPGTGTALLFNLPLGGLFLHRALKEGFVSWEVLIWVAPITTVAIVTAIPIPFAIVRWLANPKHFSG